jgi:REP element-mobilizing transposase RayT
MGRPSRAETFSPHEVCTIHAVQRCVRRAFLTGVDEKTGRDFSMRREWIRRRLEALASVFGIDVLSYAIMSNHLHVILRNRPDVVQQWTDEQVALRWLRIFPGRRLEEQLAEPTESDVERLAGNAERIGEIRERLSDISWFMRALCEPIARLANKQDECTGRFWEGRFKAQRIADEAGLLACSMYVDMNPIKAAMAESPEQATHTSAYDRLGGQKGQKIESAALDLVAVSNEQAGEEIKSKPASQRRRERAAKRRSPTGKRIRRDGWLAPLTLGPKLASDPELHGDGLRASDKGFLNISLEKYLALLRWTARQRSPSESGEVPRALRETLTQLGIEASLWRDLVWNYKRYFGRSTCTGSRESMAADAQRHGKHHHHGQRHAAVCFTTD